MPFSARMVITFCADTCRSASTSSTVRPAACRSSAICTANVVLPVPPLVLPTVTIIWR